VIPLELSVVERLSQHWSLQSSVFYSPAGQNALVERGARVVGNERGSCASRQCVLDEVDSASDSDE